MRIKFRFRFRFSPRPRTFRQGLFLRRPARKAKGGPIARERGAGGGRGGAGGAANSDDEEGPLPEVVAAEGAVQADLAGDESDAAPIARDLNPIA
jgi:hypothetical protein